MPPPSPLPPRAASARAQALKAERGGDLPGALEAYRTALAETPDDPDALTSVARIAERLEMNEVAAQVWARVAALAPDRLEAVDGQARTLCAMGRAGDAITLLRETLLAHPEESKLWNALGVALTQDGQAELAITFLDEALRLDPRFAAALYNRGGALFDLGRLEAAASDLAGARKLARKPADAAMIDFAAATLQLARGELGAGWDAYEGRFSRDLPDAAALRAPGRRWTPDLRLEGKRLLILGEQGLGDELMFANVIPDALGAVGPDGHVTIAVEPRLTALFARSFPQAEVVAHATHADGGARVRTVETLAKAPEIWAPLASLPRRFRRELSAFPAAGGYLRADPQRVAYWRDWLGDGPPAVGLSWRSGSMQGDRRRHYPPLEAWAPVLANPGARFVTVQYGAADEELATLSALAGAPLLRPPDIDLREDIDDLAALCAALSMVVSVANATGALAGACGCPLAMISGPWSWPKLGTEAYPWYPQARGFAPEGFGLWEPVLQDVAAAVARATGG